MHASHAKSRQEVLKMSVSASKEVSSGEFPQNGHFSGGDHGSHSPWIVLEISRRMHSGAHKAACVASPRWLQLSVSCHSPVARRAERSCCRPGGAASKPVRQVRRRFPINKTSTRRVQSLIAKHVNDTTELQLK